MLGIELPAFTMANKTRKCAALGTHFWAMDREKRENPILIDWLTYFVTLVQEK